MVQTPKVVSVSPVAMPTRAYAVGSRSSPAPTPSVQRARNASIVLGSGSAPLSAAGSASLSEGQQRAAAVQAAHRECGARPQLPALRTPTVLKGLKEADLRLQGGAAASGTDGAEHAARSVSELATRPWEVPRVDREAMKDPYLRAQGLHRNNTILGSHTMKRLFAERNFHGDLNKVDFNFKYCP